MLSENPVPEETAPPQPAASLKAVQKLCMDLFKQKAVIETVKERLKKENETRGILEKKILASFEEADCSSQKIKGLGSVFLKEDISYKTPKSLEEKADLRGYMGEDRWEALASINSKTLNSWAKAEFEKAVEEGNHNFKIPGLEDPTMSTKVSTRKG